MKSAILEHALSAACTLIFTAIASSQTSVQSGVWNDPTTWDGGTVPGTTATVTIAAGHTVGLTAPGLRATTRTVGALTVEGTLTATYPEGTTGQSVRIVTSSLTNHGVIRAEPSLSGNGGDVRLATPWTLTLFPPAFGPVPGTFENVGSVLGGASGAPDRSGGDVNVLYPGGTADNLGLMRGGDGDRGGSVRVVGADAVNGDGGLIRGGNGVLGNGGRASLVGSIFPPLGVTSSTNSENALLRGGDSVEGRGGNARLEAWSTGSALNAGRVLPGDAPGEIRGGDGCTAGNAAVFAAVVTQRGVVGPGTALPGNCPPPPPRRTFIDPPDLVLEGDAHITGDIIEFAGENLTIGNLTNPAAIQATDELRITLAPGGTLDLSAAVPGDLGAGTSSTVRADQVVLPPGLSLEDLFTGPVALEPGAAITEVWVGHETRDSIAPGETIEVDLLIYNAGNAAQDVHIDVELLGDLSYAGPGAADEILEPGGVLAVEYGAAVTAPFSAVPGSEHRLRMTATGTTQDGGAFETVREITFDVTSEQCSAESYGSGDFSLFFQPGSLPFSFVGTLRASGAPSLGLGFLFVALGPWDSGSAFPFPLHVNPSQLVLSEVLFFGGDGTLALPAPLKLPGGSGVTLYAQLLAADPNGQGQFLGSNGLALTFCP